MAAASPPAPSRRWLFGPVPDLLLGCGLGYAVVFVLLSVDGGGFRELFAPGLIPLLSVIGGTPHYGATLLRVYGERENRRKYFFFSVVATAIVLALFVAGLYEAMVGSLLLSLYLTWSPWHYTGQNYGIALLFLGRRGVRIHPFEKRIFHLSFLLSYLLVVLSIHGTLPGADYAPIQYPGTYRFLTVGLPAGFVAPVFAGMAILYGVLAVAALGLLARRASLRDLGPTAALFLTQALWFSAPAVCRHFGVLGSVDPFAVEHIGYVFAWVAFGHAVQYLWVTTYFAKGQRPLAEKARYYGVCLAAGAALWGVPMLVFRGPLEPAFGVSSVFVMVMAAANLHHFILDGAIWKLRDGPVARVLLRSVDPAPHGLAPSQGGFFRPLVLAVGGVLAAVTVTTIVVGEIGFRRSLEAGDLVAARRSLSALDFLGRSHAEQHGLLADEAFRQGQLPMAGHEYEASVKLRPTAAGWRGVAKVAEQSGHWREAASAHESAALLETAPAVQLYQAGAAWRKAGDAVRAVAALEEASRLAPDDKLIRSVLHLARRDAGRGAGEDRSVSAGP